MKTAQLTSSLGRGRRSRLNRMWNFAGPRHFHVLVDVASCLLKQPSLNLYTDAAGSLGYGGIFGSKWFFGAWPDDWKNFNITILEFYPIVLSVLLFGDAMRNQRITFFTDNAALVDIINKATSRDATVMVFVRRLVLACLSFNILFRARHVPGVKNVLADSLSRLQVSRFRQLLQWVYNPCRQPSRFRYYHTIGSYNI